MKTSDENFKIGLKAKSLCFKLYDLVQNIPRKDYFLKERINITTFNLLEIIYRMNNSRGELEEFRDQIKSNIAIIDFLLEILYKKQYISIKQLEEKTWLLEELLKMTSKWKLKKDE